MSHWDAEGLWNGVVGPNRSPGDVHVEAIRAGQTVRQWLAVAVTEAREAGLDDTRKDEEIVSLLAAISGTP